MDAEVKKLHEWRWRSFERALVRVCRSLKPKRVLEWGPGRSTAITLRECPDAHILTLEHSPKYHEEVSRLFAGDSRVEIEMRTISTKGGASTGYVSYPLWQNIRDHGRPTPVYDMVFVDGRFRFDCLTVARMLVKQNGVVILHDAHRKNYHPAVDLFPHVWRDEKARTIVMSMSPMPFMDDMPSGPMKNTVEGVENTMSQLRERFVSGRPFTYLRFGDADLYFINDPDFNKNRRHDPDPRMSHDLKQAFTVEHPDYLIGCASKGVFSGEKSRELEGLAFSLHEGKTFYSAVALQVVFMKHPGMFEQFVRECFHGRRVLFIGGESVSRDPLVQKVFDVTATIEFTDRNAFQILDAKMSQIEKNVPKFDVMVSALGQATRCLGWRLWDTGHRTQYFDVGSVVDALAGRKLRSWIKRAPELRDRYVSMFG